MLESALRLPTGNLGSSGMGQPSPPTLSTGTPGTWSQTAANLEARVDVPKKSNAGIAIAAGMLAVLLLGGGGFAAMSVLRDKKAPAPAASLDPGVTAAAEQAERDRLAKLEAERAAAEVATKKAEADRAAAELAAQKAQAVEVATTPSATAAAVAPRPAAPRPAVAHDSSRSGSSTSGGRKIRTTL
jgi:hypothetical protein